MWNVFDFSTCPVFLEFKKFLQRKSNSMYNFDQPVVMKVGMNTLAKIGHWHQNSFNGVWDFWSPVTFNILFQKPFSPDWKKSQGEIINIHLYYMKMTPVLSQVTPSFLSVLLIILRPSSTCSSWSWYGRSTAPRPKLRGNTSSWDWCWTTVRSWRPCRSTHSAPLTSSSGPCLRSASTLHTFGLHLDVYSLCSCTVNRKCDIIPRHLEN